MAGREARTFIGKPIAHLVEHLAADQKPRGYAEAGDIFEIFDSHKSDKVRLAIEASGASLLPSSRPPGDGRPSGPVWNRIAAILDTYTPHERASYGLTWRHSTPAVGWPLAAEHLTRSRHRPP
jgi:hypothetical protein